MIEVRNPVTPQDTMLQCSQPGIQWGGSIPTYSQLLDELEKPEPFTLSAWAAARHNSAQTVAQKPPDSCSQTHHSAPARQATGHTAACMPLDGNSQAHAAGQGAQARTATGHHLGHPGQAHASGHGSYEPSQHADPGHQPEMQESRGAAMEMLRSDQRIYSGQESEKQKQPEHGSRAACSGLLTRGNKEDALMHQQPATVTDSLWPLSEGEAGAFESSKNGSRGPPAVPGRYELGIGANAADDRARRYPAPASGSPLPFSDIMEGAMTGTSAVLDSRATMDVSWPVLGQHIRALGLPKLKSSAIVTTDKADQQTFRSICIDQPCSERAQTAGTAAERPARAPLRERVVGLSKSCPSRAVAGDTDIQQKSAECDGARGHGLGHACPAQDSENERCLSWQEAGLGSCPGSMCYGGVMQYQKQAHRQFTPKSDRADPQLDAQLWRRKQTRRNGVRYLWDRAAHVNEPCSKGMQTLQD